MNKEERGVTEERKKKRGLDREKVGTEIESGLERKERHEGYDGSRGQTIIK